MAIAAVKNNWGTKGSNLEPQRTDLWYVLFPRELLAACNKIDPSINTGIEDTLAVEAEGVSFPEERTNSEEFFQDGSGILRLPVYDQSVESVRITFRVTLPRPGALPRIIALLAAWKQLVRSGRTVIPLDAAGKLQPFRFQVDVLMLGGNDYSSGSSTFGQIKTMLEGNIRNQNFSLTPAHRIHCTNAWLSSHQYTEITYKDTSVATISAFLQVESIRFSPPGAGQTYSPVQGVF